MIPVSEIIDPTTGVSNKIDAVAYNHIKAGIGSVEIRLTNKEIQELKDFMDNLIKYHDQISYEIERELRQIHIYNFGQNFI